MFSKRHYEAIAIAFAASKPVQPDRVEQWKRDVQHVADVFADDNPRFDRRRFLLAAGVLSEAA